MKRIFTSASALLLATTLAACAGGTLPQTVSAPSSLNDSAAPAADLSILPGMLAEAGIASEADFSIQAQGSPKSSGYVIQLAEGADLKAAMAQALAAGAKLRHRYPKLNAFSVTGGDPAKLASIGTGLSPNYLIAKEQLTGAPSTTTSTQQVPAGVQRIGASSQSLKGDGVGVAVLDSGVSPHRDLALGSKCFAVDGSCGDQTPHPGHGTHVAGIVAALDNGLDVVGVAPRATVYDVDVFGSSDYTSDDNIIAGLEWIAAEARTASPPIKVVNMSLGRPGSLSDNSTLRAAVQKLTKAGITVVVAAGNTATTEVRKSVPAGYPEVIAVASTPALDGNSMRCGSSTWQVKADTASFFTTDGKFSSNIGVSISAPGETREILSSSCGFGTEGILSTLPGNALGKMSGTSMAAPHVSGVVALMYQKRSTSVLTYDKIRTALRRGALRRGTAPISSRNSSYSYDGEREGVLSVSGSLSNI